MNGDYSSVAASIERLLHKLVEALIADHERSCFFRKSLTIHDAQVLLNITQRCACIDHELAEILPSGRQEDLNWTDTFRFIFCQRALAHLTKGGLQLSFQSVVVEVFRNSRVEVLRRGLTLHSLKNEKV